MGDEPHELGPAPTALSSNAEKRALATLRNECHQRRDQTANDATEATGFIPFSLLMMQFIKQGGLSKLIRKLNADLFDQRRNKGDDSTRSRLAR